MATVRPPEQDSPVLPIRRGNLGMYAGFVTRATAMMIDLILVAIAVLAINALIALPVAFFTGADLNNCAQTTGVRAASRAICYTINLVWVGVALLAGPLYFVTLFAATGQTIGKYVMGVRVVRLDGSAMTLTASFVRWLGYFISALPLGLGFFWVIADARRQGFHDRLAGTCVIYAWRATGSERLISRLRTRFGLAAPAPTARALPASSPVPPSTGPSTGLSTGPSTGLPDPAPGTGSYDLLALAAADLTGVGAAYQTLEAMVASHAITVLATDLLLKTAGGEVFSIRGENVAPAADFRGLTGLAPNVTPSQIAAVAAGLPPGSYILAVLLEERAADALVHQAASRAAVRISRCAIPGSSTGSPTGKPTDGAALPRK